MIKNNITFDNAAGKENVVAKITLKTAKPNKTLTSKNNCKSSKSKENIKPKDSKLSDKENISKIQPNKMTSQFNKTPIKSKNVLNNPTSAPNEISPFKKVKIIYQEQ